MTSENIDNVAADIFLKSLDYDPDTGILTWRPKDESKFDCKRWNTRYAGKEAGCLDISNGYKNIMLKSEIFRRRFKYHRVAWLVFYGEWPSKQVDHINHIRSDNRICNLRDVTHQQNCRNRGMNSNNTSGVMGVCWHREVGKWVAQSACKGEKIFVGSYASKEDAAEAICNYYESNGFHPNHGAQLCQ